MKNLVIVSCATLLFSLNSYAQINISGNKAVKLWNRIDSIGKIENIQVILVENGQQAIHLDQIECVFEMYNACSLFVNTPTERKMIVALEGTADLMDQLASAGVYVDEEYSRMDISSIDCVNDGKDTICKIEE